MGSNLFDQYTLLHFGWGIILYFWDITLFQLIIFHTLFEIIENTPTGVNFLNNTIFFWPGGKPKADTFINIIGDSIGAIFGWLIAYYIDNLGKKYDLYKF
jgi:hypothetical protein